MGKVTAKLRSPSLAGDTIHTQWGHVSFDSKGLSSLEVDEADLPRLRGLGWLLEAPSGKPEALPVKAKAAPEPIAPPAAEPEPTPEPAVAEPVPFDVTDAGETVTVRKRKR